MYNTTVMAEVHTEVIAVGAGEPSFKERRDQAIAKLYDVEIVDAPPLMHIITTAPTSQPPEIRCLSCGYEYGSLVPLIHSAVRYRQKKFLRRSIYR